MPGKIELVIREGKISIEVSGVDDASCAQLTAILEQELGTVEDVQHKPEFFVALDGVEQHVYEEK